MYESAVRFALSLYILAVRAPTNHNPHHTQIKSLKTMKFIEENCRRILSIVKILNTHLVHIIHGLALDCNRFSADIQNVTRIIISSGKFLISVRFFFSAANNLFLHVDSIALFHTHILQTGFLRDVAVIKTTIVIWTEFITMHMLRYWCIPNK